MAHANAPFLMVDSEKGGGRGRVCVLVGAWAWTSVLPICIGAFLSRKDAFAAHMIC